MRGNTDFMGDLTLIHPLVTNVSQNNSSLKGHCHVLYQFLNKIGCHIFH